MYPTNIGVARSIFWDVVVKFVILEEVERLECVEDEVAYILVHVGLEYSTVKVVNCTTAVHHLSQVNKHTCTRHLLQQYLPERRVPVDSLCQDVNSMRTHAIPERLGGVFTTRRYTNPRLPYLTS